MTQITRAAADAPQQLTLFDLDELEQKVRRGLKTFVEVGEALRAIRDGNGHVMRGFKTFEDYCEKEFGISIRQGQRLIEAAAVARTVEALTGELPKNEAQAREIAKVADQPAVLKKVITEVKRAKTTLANATAEVVAQAVAKVTGKAQPKPEPKPAPEPEPETAPLIPEVLVDADLQDFCPVCGELPDQFVRKGRAWQCPGCKAEVRLTVTPWKAAA